MLIAISGSQGAGKTTIINRIKDIGYPVVERKTSRSILEEWGVTLQEVNNNAELIIRFQDEVLKRKYDDEVGASKSSNIWFTERTFVDLLTYATISLGKENRYSDWLNEYGSTCLCNQSIYSQVFYLTAGHFSVEQDNVRGHNKFYSSLVDASMLSFYQLYHPPQGNFLVISTPSFRERINIILEEVKQYDKKKNSRAVY